MKRIIIAAVISFAAAVVAAIPAYADPDKNAHVPEMGSGTCPGGYGVSENLEQHCLGKPYPDRSQWLEAKPATPFPGSALHQTPNAKSRFRCVIIPTPSTIIIASPGGCRRK